MAKFKLANPSVTLINRGGLKFHSVNGVFDTDLYADPGLLFTSSKLATPLSAETIKAAQNEVIEMAKNVGAEFIVEKSKAKKEDSAE
jgi:predicted Co/Zn/Cd cation transporter (cation efflux family)